MHCIHSAFVVEVDGSNRGSYNFGEEDNFAAKYRIYCGNSESGFENNIELKKGVAPLNFLDYGGILWYQQAYPISESVEFEQANGYAIISMETPRI